MIEMDDGCFTVVIEKAKGKRDRGTDGKLNVAIMSRSTQIEDIETGKKASQCRYFKSKVLETHKAIEINHAVDE
jgi:hypothetical protein